MDQIHQRGRGGKRLQRKPKSKSGVRLAALLLCLAMLAGFLPTLAAAVDGGEKLSSIVEFQSITLRYAGTGGQAVGAQVPENALLESGEPLRLCYTYEITQEQCKLIKADTPYYLEVSPHLSLPDMQDGSPLILTDDDKKVPFGTIYADGSRAWVAFLAKEGGTDTVLSDYGELRNADFYLDCERAAEVPEGEDPIDGTSNLYVMKFENSEKFSLPFGYAEREPVAARAKIEKDGALEGRTITWTIKYTPWQNPAGADGVDLDTPFELRDTIDTSLHRYVEGSVKIDGRPAAVYATREAIPEDKDAYVLEETSGGSTILILGGTALNAGQATQGSPAAPLEITYETMINEELLLPGGTGGQSVTNAADLFAGDGRGAFHALSIRGSSTVPVPQPKWLAKTGKTTRHPDGMGSTTVWTVTFEPNGFSFGAENQLTLHDMLPEGSTLAEDSVEVDGVKVSVEWETAREFTISGITTDNQPVTITYQTHASEEMYDSGTSLGSNTAWFTFEYGRKRETPKASTPVGSGDGTGTPDTATMVKSSARYDSKSRTIVWTVAINPHQAYLQSGTFTDDLSKAGPRCPVGQHTSGLELAGGIGDITVRIDGREPTDAEWALLDLKYERQVLTLTVKKDGTDVIGAKTITLTYAAKVCDPCVFANNRTKVLFTNTVSTEDMVIGRQAAEGRSDSAGSTETVNVTVLTKQAPVYDYARGIMTWTVEVDAAGLPMRGVVLTDDLREGLTYVEDSLTTKPEIAGASAEAQGQELTIRLGEVAEKTTVAFETNVDPELLGFGGREDVVVANEIRMSGEADGLEFAEVSHQVQQKFTNHGLVKGSAVDNQQELIQYQVLINPFGLALPKNPSLVDTLDKRLQLDTDTMLFYKAELTGTTGAKDQKPGYRLDGAGEPVKITGFDPAENRFTVQLPIDAGSRDAYVLTYTADIIDFQTGGYSNSVHFEGGSVFLGGNKNNSSSVGGGGGGGGGGAAARKAAISIVKTDSETGEPLSGVSFLLYQWDHENNVRGLPFAQGRTDADGTMSFQVKPGAFYQLVETESAPGYETTWHLTNSPDGVTEADGGLIIQAGEAKSILTLELTNEAHTTDIVFRLVNESGIPMAGSIVQLFKDDPAGGQSPVPTLEVTVEPDGTVRFPKIRRGARYYIRQPDGEILTIEVPAPVHEDPKVTMPDGTTAALTEDTPITGTTAPDQQWELTVHKVISGGTTPLKGATIGLYADKDAQTLIQAADSGQDGSILFSGLIRGQSYWLKEIKAPANYDLDGGIYEAKEETAAVTIANQPKTQPAGPDAPGNSGNSGTPTDPGNPGNPGTPTDPNNPGNPGTPTDPNNPGNPGTPTDPNNPGNPGVPADSDSSSDPGTPGDGGTGALASPDSGGGGSSAGDPDIPQTGAQLGLLIALVFLSGLLLAGLTIYRFFARKRSEQ